MGQVVPMKPHLLFAYSICAALITGCATAPVEYKTVEVKVPVSVPCVIDSLDEPIWARNRITKDSNIDELAKAHVAELIQRESYENELKASIKGCQ